MEDMVTEADRIEGSFCAASCSSYVNKFEIGIERPCHKIETFARQSGGTTWVTNLTMIMVVKKT